MIYCVKDKNNKKLLQNNSYINFIDLSIVLFFKLFFINKYNKSIYALKYIFKLF